MTATQEPLPVEQAVAQFRKDEPEAGFWRSCTGCHELNEGHDTGPFSKAFGCALGGGCSECGGIGATWDDADYFDVSAWMATPEQPEQDRAVVEWAWLATNPSHELSYEGWEDDVWQVHRVNGGRNDREWTLIATGDTPLEAVRAAIAATPPAPQNLAKDTIDG